MDETWRGRVNVLRTMHDLVLIRRYTLDHAGIMFVTDLIRDMPTSQTSRWNAIVPEMDVISTLTYLATGKMQLCRSDDLGPSQPSISKVITQTFIALSELYYVAVHFLKKYDSMVNKNKKKIYIYIYIYIYTYTLLGSGKKEVPALIRPPPPFNYLFIYLFIINK